MSERDGYIRSERLPLRRIKRKVIIFFIGEGRHPRRQEGYFYFIRKVYFPFVFNFYIRDARAESRAAGTHALNDSLMRAASLYFYI